MHDKQSISSELPQVRGRRENGSTQRQGMHTRKPASLIKKRAPEECGLGQSHLFCCNLWQTFLLVDDASTELVGEAYAERRISLPIILSLLQC